MLERQQIAKKSTLLTTENFNMAMEDDSSRSINIPFLRIDRALFLFFLLINYRTPASPLTLYLFAYFKRYNQLPPR
jgi:hypothetical protein